MLFLLSILAIIGLVMIKRFSKTAIPDAVRALAIAVLVLVAVSSCITVVPAGNVGVVDFFGTVSTNTLKAGINFINPFARVIKFSIKTQETMENLAVPSKEGLNIQLHVSCIYHLNPEKAAEVYKSVGKDYAEILMVPQFRSVCRGVTASYEAKALYTSEREMLSDLIKKDLDKIVEPRGIVIESVPMREIVLPAGLQQAIEEKLRAEQESQRMQFVLMKERQEADRKKIEAQGIWAFQDIIARGLSDKLLTWKGIEATEKLANSQNTKVIIVGGKDGLPLILDTK
jgi:prohibitin 1